MVNNGAVMSLQSISNSSGKLVRLLTEREAATYIGMSISFLRQARSNGERLNRTPAPHPIQIGRSVRYRLDDLDSWIDQL